MGNASYSNPNKGNKVQLPLRSRVFRTGEYTDIDCHCTIEEVDIHAELSRVYPDYMGNYSPYCSVILAILFVLSLPSLMFANRILTLLPFLPYSLYLYEAHTYWRICEKHLFGHNVQCEQGVFHQYTPLTLLVMPLFYYLY